MATTREQRHDLFLRHKQTIRSYLEQKLRGKIVHLVYDGLGGTAVMEHGGSIYIDQLVADWVNAEVEGLEQRPDQESYDWEPKAKSGV